MSEENMQRCQDAETHPDTIVMWEGVQRGCPMCTLARRAERAEEKRERDKAKHAVVLANHLAKLEALSEKVDSLQRTSEVQGGLYDQLKAAQDERNRNRFDDFLGAVAREVSKRRGDG